MRSSYNRTVSASETLYPNYTRDIALISGMLSFKCVDYVYISKFSYDGRSMELVCI